MKTVSHQRNRRNRRLARARRKDPVRAKARKRRMRLGRRR